MYSSFQVKTNMVMFSLHEQIIIIMAVGGGGGGEDDDDLYSTIIARDSVQSA